LKEINVEFEKKEISILKRTKDRKHTSLDVRSE